VSFYSLCFYFCWNVPVKRYLYVRSVPPYECKEIGVEVSSYIEGIWLVIKFSAEFSVKDTHSYWIKSWGYRGICFRDFI